MAPRPALLLAAIVVAAALLRLWHHDFDIGHTFVPDAEEKVAQAMAVSRGNLVPHNWKQPYFLPYSGGAVLAAVGLFHPVDRAVAKRAMTLYMIALSLATLLLLHRTALVLFESRPVALLATAILAFAPMNVMGSRYIKEDIPLLLWTQLALLFVFLIVKRGRPRDYLCAGLAVGAAIGTKHVGALLVPLFVAACAVRARATGQGLRQVLGGWPLVGAQLILLAALAFNPFVLIRTDEFIAGVRFQGGYALAGHHDGTRVTPWSQLWTFYLREALLPGLTWPIVVACLAALPLALRLRRSPRDGVVALLAAWTIVVYFAFEASPSKPYPFFARYLHPLTPSVALLAAWALWRARRALAARLPAPGGGAVAGALVAAAVAWPLGQSVLVSAALGDDTRLQARRWIEGNLPPRAQVVVDGSFYGPPLDEPPLPVGRAPAIVAARVYDTPLEGLADGGIDYLVLSSFRWDRFAASAGTSDEAARADRYYRAIRRRLTPLREFRPAVALQTYGFHNPIIAIYAVR
jgi:4-amino-4-deoxy-L-arabinose transferase-like glycosyltransferase